MFAHRASEDSAQALPSPAALLSLTPLLEVELRPSVPRKSSFTMRCSSTDSQMRRVAKLGWIDPSTPSKETRPQYRNGHMHRNVRKSVLWLLRKGREAVGPSEGNNGTRAVRDLVICRIVNFNAGALRPTNLIHRSHTTVLTIWLLIWVKLI